MEAPLNINSKDYYDEIIPSGITQPCFNYHLIDLSLNPVTTFTEPYLTFSAATSTLKVEATNWDHLGTVSL